MTLLAAICMAFSAGLYQFTFIATCAGFAIFVTSHDEEVENPLPAKKSFQITMTKGRAALPDPTIPYPP